MSSSPRKKIQSSAAYDENSTLQENPTRRKLPVNTKERPRVSPRKQGLTDTTCRKSPRKTANNASTEKKTHQHLTPAQKRRFDGRKFMSSEGTENGEMSAGAFYGAYRSKYLNPLERKEITKIKGSAADGASTTEESPSSKIPEPQNAKPVKRRSKPLTPQNSNLDHPRTVVARKPSHLDIMKKSTSSDADVDNFVKAEESKAEDETQPLPTCPNKKFFKHRKSPASLERRPSGGGSGVVVSKGFNLKFTPNRVTPGIRGTNSKSSPENHSKPCKPPLTFVKSSTEKKLPVETSGIASSDLKSTVPDKVNFGKDETSVPEEQNPYSQDLFSEDSQPSTMDEGKKLWARTLIPESDSAVFSCDQNAGSGSNSPDESRADSVLLVSELSLDGVANSAGNIISS